MPRLNLNLNPKHIDCDFEYRFPEPYRMQLILGCFYVRELDRWYDIDFRNFEQGRRALLELYHRFKGDIFICYGGWEMAEITCFEAAGIDVRGMHWIDLSTEVNQIITSHHEFWLPPSRRSLLGVLELFQVPTRGSSILKQRARDRILATDQYTDEEWTEFIDYCHSDIEPLAVLHQRIMHVMQGPLRATPYTENTSLFHGDYLVAQAHADATSRGFPIDVPLLDRISKHRVAIANLLAEECNRQFDAPLYRYVARSDSYAENEQALRDLADRHGVLELWELTPKGHMKRDEDFLDQFCKRFPIFRPIKDTRVMRQQLRKMEWTERLHDGFIKGINAPMHARTGRNQPMAGKGMILGQSVWLRCIMRPQPGYCIIGADFSQEELVIAAALSGDPMLIDAVTSGDTYLALAIMAGVVPQDATEETHPLERQLFKSLALGISYGMQKVSLAHSIHADQLAKGGTMTIDEALEKAIELLKWHKRTFRVFWQWQTNQVNDAYKYRYIAAPDQWTCFVKSTEPYRTPSTRIANFPMQAGGACLLRECIKRLAKEDDIELIASHHDAIYTLCRTEDVPTQRIKLERCMSQAVTYFMQVAIKPIPIKIKTKVYTHAEGYHDPRGAAMYAKIMAKLDQIDSQEDNHENSMPEPRKGIHTVVAV